MGFIFIIGIFQAFFLVLILLGKKEKSLSDKILTVWIFFLGVHLLSYYVMHIGVQTDYPLFTGLANPFPAIHGPFLYLYTIYYSREKQQFRWFDSLHFLPALLIYMYEFFLGDMETKIEFINDMDSVEPSSNFFLYLTVISGVVYVTMSLLALKKYKSLITKNFSNVERISLNWLRNLIFGLAGIWIVVILIHLITGLVQPSIHLEENIFIYSAVSLFILLLGYYGIKQVGVFSNSTIVFEENVDKTIEAENQYAKSGLKAGQAKIHHELLVSIMAESKPYLQSKLTLGQLAEQLAIKPNHLSQVINQFEGSNFYDFINKYRVEEFKKRVMDPKNSHLNILAIAYDSGFNSKSSFNSVFLKLTNHMPSKYLKSIAVSTQNRK
jgi:AraC-like DNA-binding protein